MVCHSMGEMADGHQSDAHPPPSHTRLWPFIITRTFQNIIPLQALLLIPPISALLHFRLYITPLHSCRSCKPKARSFVNPHHLSNNNHRLRYLLYFTRPVLADHSETLSGFRDACPFVRPTPRRKKETAIFILRASTHHSLGLQAKYKVWRTLQLVKVTADCETEYSIARKCLSTRPALIYFLSHPPSSLGKSTHNHISPMYSSRGAVSHVLPNLVLSPTNLVPRSVR